MQLWEIIQREPKWPLPQLKSESESCSVESWLFATPWTIYSPWNSPSQNTGVGSHSLLQGIFPTQGSSPGLPYCRQILHQLSHRGSPRILEWVVCPFSSGSSQPRIELGSPELQAESSPAEPQGKHKNTGVGSLSFLQQIFLTQKLNWDLVHCRWIPYQLSYTPVTQWEHLGKTSV